MTAAPNIREGSPEILEYLGPYLVDLRTGEIVSMDDGSPERPWSPSTEDDIEWCLSLIEDERVQADAIQRRITNLEAMKRRHVTRGKWLTDRFSPGMQAWLLDRLGPRGKRREHSRLFEHGRIGWRMSRRSITVPNEDVAVSWATVNCPEAVKITRSVLVSMIPDELLKDAPVEVHEPEDKFYAGNSA